MFDMFEKLSARLDEMSAKREGTSPRKAEGYEPKSHFNPLFEGTSPAPQRVMVARE